MADLRLVDLKQDDLPAAIALVKFLDSRYVTREEHDRVVESKLAELMDIDPSIGVQRAAHVPGGQL